MFWATVIDGTRLVSWNTMAMPSAKASDGADSVDRLAVEQHFAGGELVHAGQRLGQRRLAGAVLADDRVDFAVLEREVDILDRGDAAEFLGRLAQFEDRAHDGRAPTGSSAAPESRTSMPGPFAATIRSARSSHTEVTPWIVPSARL